MQTKFLQQEKMMRANSGCESIIPMKATFSSLYKWPESDCEFIESIVLRGSEGRSRSMHGGVGTAVDGISCRQLYLRSYTFSTEDDYSTIINCFGRRSENKMRRRFRGGSRNKSAAKSVIRRWLCCSITDAFR